MCVWLCGIDMKKKSSEKFHRLLLAAMLSLFTVNDLNFVLHSHLLRKCRAIFMRKSELIFFWAYF